LADAYLHTQGISNPTEELDVGTIKLSGALANPQHMSGAIVPQASGGILAGESLLVREQQTLMRGIELCGSHHGMIGSQSASRHKAQCLIHMVGQIPISAEKSRRRRRKIL
jgi:hypothetical protein